MSFFQPHLRVRVNPKDGTYSVEALVLVPSGCYVANGTTLDPPSGIVVIPEVQAIQLHIDRHHGPCIQMVSFVRFVRHGLPLSGKDRLTAFAMLRDPDSGHEELVGRASIELPKGLAELRAKPAVAPGSGAWIGAGEVSGWIDRMPGVTPTVYVQVGMWAPTSGYTYDLKLDGAFGFTGRTIRCEMTATRPSGTVLDVITHTVVTAHRKLTSKEDFDSALVEFEGNFELGPVITVF
jgi:hypothetical protein